MEEIAAAVVVGADAEISGSDNFSKSMKRKIVSSAAAALSVEDREARIGDLRAEIEGLFGYLEGVLGEKVDLEVGQCGSMHAAVAVLLGESRLPLSKLVAEIYEKVKARDNGDCVTLAGVKSSVFLISQIADLG